MCNSGVIKAGGSCNLEQFTVVIVSLNRQRFLQRQVDYWGGTCSRILIVDGSEFPMDLKIDDSKKYRCTYIHDPKDLAYRCRLSLGFIRTKYIAMLPDDEFLIPSAVSSFIEELEINPEIDAITGRTIRFFERNGEIYGEPVYGVFDADLMTDSKGLEGIASFWNRDGFVIHYPIYSIMRSTAFIKSVGAAYSQAQENAYGSEIKFNLVFPFFFKSVLRSRLYWLRSDENNPITHSHFDRSERFSEWFTKSENRTKADEFVTDIVATIYEDRNSEVQSRKLVESILSRYCEMDIKMHSVQSDVLVERLAKLINQVFGQRMKRCIKALVPFAIRKKIGYQLQSFEALGKQLASRGVELDQNELSRIGQFVLDFHQKS